MSCMQLMFAGITQSNTYQRVFWFTARGEMLLAYCNQLFVVRIKSKVCIAPIGIGLGKLSRWRGRDITAHHFQINHKDILVAEINKIDT